MHHFHFTIRHESFAIQYPPQHRQAACGTFGLPNLPSETTAFADNRQPTTDNRQPTTDNRQPTTDNRIPTRANS
ncbi:hypothetical protein [Puniceicoccus vermicola]|uniref:Uncharacterized protein n=1 Tax=Puniceicoccus vermicola TaxID=388746 RepID=A0A7X1E533_9BACT|nr:hypothetical protein [Puniceicoccus vermicola]MBC2601207.1 hypothetical protein [Puniceicoccus vermicola]